MGTSLSYEKIESRHRLIIGIMVLLLGACILLSFAIGRYPVSPTELLGILGSKAGHVGNLGCPAESGTYALVLVEGH